MTLGELLKAASGRAPFDARTASMVPELSAAAVVTSVTSDSREVSPGGLFVALRGFNADGLQFARDAIARGAIGSLSAGHWASTGRLTVSPMTKC